jgi:hypothetical protein
MNTTKTAAFPKLAYSIENLSLASDVGRTSIYAAIRAGELEAFNPTVNGKKLKRTLVTPQAAKRWMDKISSGEAA